MRTGRIIIILPALAWLSLASSAHAKFEVASATQMKADDACAQLVAHSAMVAQGKSHETLTVRDARSGQTVSAPAARPLVDACRTQSADCATAAAAVRRNGQIMSDLTCSQKPKPVRVACDEDWLKRADGSSAKPHAFWIWALSLKPGYRCASTGDWHTQYMFCAGACP